MSTTEARTGTTLSGATARTGGRGVRTWVVLLLGLGLAVGAALLWRTGAGPLPDPEGCRAEVGDTTVSLTPGQA